MITRLLKNSDALEHEKTAAQAYILRFDPDSEQKLPNDSMIGCFEDDDKTLMADMEINRFVCSFNGKELSCAAVGGVASRPEFRNRGAVRSLFGYLYDNFDYDISILYPFSSYFYGKMGYTSMGLFADVEVAYKEFGLVERNSSAVLFDESRSDDILKVYNNWASQNNLAYIRNNLSFFSTKPYETASYTYVWYNSEGEASSYITFSPDRPNRTINVDEIGFVDYGSLCGIMGFMKNYEGNYDKLHFVRIPLYSPLFSLIANVERTKICMHNLGAARIINPLRVLSMVRYPDDKGEFTVRIIDKNGPADGTFTVAFENGEGKAVRSDREPDYIMDILTANKLLLEGISETDLKFNPGLQTVKFNKDFIRSFSVKDTFFVGGF